MFIICCGPDTFRAQQSARMLEEAFRDKHDTESTSIERISFGKGAIKELEERAQTMSLFRPKRFFRTRNVLNEITKKELPSLIRVLTKNTDDSIIVSVEDDVPKQTLLNELEKEVKIIKYYCPQLRGEKFFEWALAQAKKIGYHDKESIKKISLQFESDSWRVWNELIKLRAGGTATTNKQTNENVFSIIDNILENKRERFSFATNEDLSKEVCALLPSQMRNAVRVRDAHSNGIHAYVKSKLLKSNLHNSERALFFADTMYLLQRQGHMSENEASLLAP